MDVRSLPLTAVALLLFPPQGQFRLVASYAPGARIDGRATLRIDVAEDEVSFTVDGESGTDHDRRLRMLHVEDVRWTDTVGSMDAARVTALTRRFEEAAGAISFEEIDETDETDNVSGPHTVDSPDP